MNPAAQFAAKVFPALGGWLAGGGIYLLIVNAGVGAVVLLVVGLLVAGTGVVLRKRRDQDSSLQGRGRAR